MPSNAASNGLNASPVNRPCSGWRICVFQLARRLWSCSSVKWLSTLFSQPCHSLRTRSIKALASNTRPGSRSSGFSSSSSASYLPNGNTGCAKNSNSSSHKRILLRKLSSMLIRSMPSVYSAIRGSGITTSSLILKALVWREMAAVRLRSAQNFLADSGVVAIKPSPARLLAMRTTSLVALATASISSPTISPISTILGKPLPPKSPLAPRLLLVA